MPEFPASAEAPLARHVREVHRRHHPAEGVNVGEMERLASVIGGGGLVIYGLGRGTLAGAGLALIGGMLVYRGVTGHCHGYGALGLSTAQSRGPRDSVAAQHGAKVEASITVNRPREELYRFWRDLSNLPRIMNHLESVQTTGGRRSHWVAKGPLGARVEWDAEIITERENELIGWRSVGDSDVDAAGSVHFTPASDGRSTEVQVVLKYDPPAGKLGVAVAELLGQAPDQQIREDLRRFKAVMEANPASASGT